MIKLIIGLNISTGFTFDISLWFVCIKLRWKVFLPHYSNITSWRIKFFRLEKIFLYKCIAIVFVKFYVERLIDFLAGTDNNNYTQ